MLTADQTAQLQAQLAALSMAIASGATRVSYDGQSAEYRDLPSMLRVRDDLMRQLGQTVAARRTVAAFTNGFF